MQVNDRELRAQQRAALMAIKSLPVMGGRGNEPTRGRRSVIILLQGIDATVRATAYSQIIFFEGRLDGDMRYKWGLARDAMFDIVQREQLMTTLEFEQLDV